MPIAFFSYTVFVKEFKRFLFLFFVVSISFFVLFLNKSYAAVSVGEITNSGTLEASNVTWSHTVSGSNRLLVVGVGLRNFTTITSVTYGGVALTKANAIGAGAGNYARSEIWYLKNPAVGTANIVVTNSATEWMATGAVTFTGVDQTTPVRASSNDVSSNTSSTTNTLTVTPTVSGDLIVDNLAYWYNAGWATPNALQTQLLAASDSGGWRSGMSYRVATTTSTPMSWTVGSNVVGMAQTGFAIIPAADPPVISATAPATNSTISTQVVSYTLSKAVTSASIVFTRTGGTADATTHTCALQGTALNSGAHTNLTLATGANACAAWTNLVNGAIYTVTYNATDSGGLTATTVTNTGVTYGYFSGSGAGTVGSPYLITSCTQLQEVKYNLSAYYNLSNNIDCTAVSNFATLGNFTGVFNGNNYSVSNITMTTAGSLADMGLFSKISACTIQNLKLLNFQLSASLYSNVGILAGSMDPVACTVSNVSVSGAVSGVNYVGGLIGMQNTTAGTITNCSSSATVTSTGNGIGGLIGRNSGTITGSYATGSMASNALYIGGLTGQNFGTISKSYARGNITGNSYYSGGLVGLDGGSILNSFAMGNVTGTDYIGGLIGRKTTDTIEVTNSFSKGLITSSGSNVGGFIGLNEGTGTINSCYYDTTTSGKSDTGKGTPTVTADMKLYSTFTGWDFTDTWTLSPSVNSGYPSLSGGFLINAGALYTTSTSVTLNITCPVDSWTPVQMAYGTSTNPTNWETCSSTASVTLSSGSGTKTVYVAFKDAGGTISSDSTQTIILDTTLPTGPSSVTANSGIHFINGAFNLVMNGAISDTGGSGLVSPDSYRICRSEDNLTGCSVWLAGFYSSTASISGSDLPFTNGATRYYYAYVVDNAGNTSTASIGDYATLDYVAPTTEVNISNAVYSPSTWVYASTIIGTASDLSGSGIYDVEINIQRNSDSKYWTGSVWSLTESWVAVTNGTSTWDYSFDDLELDNGVTYTVTARATDVAGNVTSSGFGSDSFSYDSAGSATPSSIVFKTPASSPGKITTPTFTIEGVVSGDLIKLFSDDCVTQVASATASGTSVDITITNPLNEGTYTFKSNSTDPYNNVSGCSSESLTYILDTTNPSVSAPGQFKEDGTTAIDQGASTLVGETTIVLKANLSDTINNVLYAEFEVNLTGDAFDGSTNIYTGSTVNYQGSELTSTVSLTDLTIEEGYHWRYRGVDSAGNVSNWVSFGTNQDGVNDFIVAAIASVVLPPGVTTFDGSFETEVVTNLAGIITLGVTDVSTGAPIALVNVDMELVTGDLVWTNLTAETSEDTAVLHYPGGFANLPGQMEGVFSLFIPKGVGNGVLVCPGATTLGEVIIGCTGGYFLDEYAPNVTIEEINGVVYWKVSGLSGTGVMSIVTNFADKSMSRLQANESSDHNLEFTTNNGLLLGTDLMILTFPSEFDFGLVDYTDIDLLSMDTQLDIDSTPSTDTWGVSVYSMNNTIIFIPPTDGTGYIPAGATIKVKIGLNATHQSTGVNQITNPISVGMYQINIQIINNVGTENGIIAVPIVDSDTVDITGYVTSFIHFDIDTATGETPGPEILGSDNTIIDCNYSGVESCLTHSGGSGGSNYTVDLGELSSAIVNKSNTTSVNHSDGGVGIINSIYFDLTTNAPGGAVITVKSLNGGLQGPGSNKISSIGVSLGADGITRSDGEDIPANSGVYGYNLPTASSTLHGTIIPNSLCDSLVKFCGASNSSHKTVFDTNSLPVDSARVRLDLAAAANYTNNPGVYTDTLTFVAVATF
jgi:hypothetical protein